ncbi:MAG: nitronate monooxygenase [Planctomycetota bacterium]
MAVPKLRIGHLTADIPLIQGGMGVGVSLSGLSSAVADCGAIGVISSACIGMTEPDFAKKPKLANRRALAKEIRDARQLSDGIIGVNIMVALSDYSEHVETALDEEADVIFLGAGLPLRFSDAVPVDRLRSTRTQIVPIVSSGRAVKLIFGQWAKRYGRVPDGVVLEGPKAGGHLGFKREQIEDPDFALERLLPDVLEAIRPFEEKYDRELPVVVAGGVYNGADMARFLSAGASGVQMGTRFVATHECDADLKFKETYLAARREDIVIIKSPVGLPGRAIRNAYLDGVEAGVRHPHKCSWRCLSSCPVKKAPYCIGDALIQAKIGELGKGFPFAGANAWRVDEIVSVRELIDSLMAEYEDAVRSSVTIAECA